MSLTNLSSQNEGVSTISCNITTVYRLQKDCVTDTSGFEVYNDTLGKVVFEGFKFFFIPRGPCSF